MHKLVPLAACCLLATSLAVQAQDATSTPDMAMTGSNTVTVTDQVSLFGMVTIDSVTLDAPGFVAIHADENGQPGHVVGVAPVSAGTSTGVLVMIDGAMATPTLFAQLHTDDGQAGVFEHSSDPSLDAPVSDAASFSLGAIAAFDQQPMNDSVVIASAIIPVDGWMVIHADNGGQPGPVLGQAPIHAGTNAPVIVPIDTANATAVVFPMLHVDDGQAGVYEFDGASGLDNPFAVNGLVATRSINLTETPTLFLADGSSIVSDVVPAISASEQELGMGDMMQMDAMATAEATMAAGDTAMMGGATFVVDSVTSPGAGFVDVHSQMDGHPAVSLGHSPVAAGDNAAVTVALMPPPAMPMMGITPVVYPMLHLDTDADGQYMYLKIPGVDLPVVYNGAVVTIPVNVTGSMVMSMDDMMGMDMTAEASGDMMGMEMTAEATTSP